KAETEYKIAATEFEMAAEQLRKRSITAPCSGYIAEITRKVGEACQPYQPLIRVVDTRKGYFVSNVEARAAGGLKPNQIVSLEIESVPAAIKLKVKTGFLSPVVELAHGLQKGGVRVGDAQCSVRPGAHGNE